MSKFFEGLEKETEKQLEVRPPRRYAEEESSETKQTSVTNKEKKHEEIEALCAQTDLKKPKDVEQFFKLLNKYQKYFAKEGLPSSLVDFLSRAASKTKLSILKQKTLKLSEKYAKPEVVLSVEKEERKQVSQMERINNTLLLTTPGQRIEQLRGIEGSPGLSLREQHRANIYILGSLIEDGPGKNTDEILERLQKEAQLAVSEEELGILQGRIGGYIRKFLEYYLQSSRHADSAVRHSLLAPLFAAARDLLPLTSTPYKIMLESEFFLVCSKHIEKAPSTCGRQEEMLSPLPETDSSLSFFSCLLGIRHRKLRISLEEYRGMESKVQTEEETSTEIVCLVKIAEEMGHALFEEKEYHASADFLEEAYFRPFPWPCRTTRILLSVLSLCMPESMKHRKFFLEFSQKVQLVGLNPLLLKSHELWNEMARAYLLLKLGRYVETEAIIRDVLQKSLPASFSGFNCLHLLRTKAYESIARERSG